MKTLSVLLVLLMASTAMAFSVGEPMPTEENLIPAGVQPIPGGLVIHYHLGDKCYQTFYYSACVDKPVVIYDFLSNTALIDSDGDGKIDKVLVNPTGQPTDHFPKCL